MKLIYNLNSWHDQTFLCLSAEVCSQQSTNDHAVGLASALATFWRVASAVRFAALGLHTVPMVCEAVIQTAVRVVGVAVSLILVVGLTPTVISALPVPC